MSYNFFLGEKNTTRATHSYRIGCPIKELREEEESKKKKKRRQAQMGTFLSIRSPLLEKKRRTEIYC